MMARQIDESEQASEKASTLWRRKKRRRRKRRKEKIFNTHQEKLRTLFISVLKSTRLVAKLNWKLDFFVAAVKQLDNLTTNF